ncbi:MAG TPA: DUF4157 domain-containing protein [Bdellovibrionota bacterium]|nr:DUF4157 domain-containing protein [Bdellovibrionota bacterium]
MKNTDVKGGSGMAIKRLVIFFLVIAVSYSAYANTDGVIVRVSEIEKDNLNRLKAIQETSESSSRRLEISINNISYDKQHRVKGYHMTARVLHLPLKDYPSESYEIYEIAYSPIKRIASFRYATPSSNFFCTANGTHHLVDPIPMKRGVNYTPPMLALSSQGKVGMEQLFGKDYQRVRVRSNQIKEKSADSMQAEALSIGRDLYFSQHGANPVQIPFECH